MAARSGVSVTGNLVDAEAAHVCHGALLRGGFQQSRVKSLLRIYESFYLQRLRCVCGA